MHIYERVHPVLNGTTAYNNTDTTHQVYTNPGMTVHAVQGSAGVFEVPYFFGCLYYAAHVAQLVLNTYGVCRIIRGCPRCRSGPPCACPSSAMGA